MRWIRPGDLDVVPRPSPGTGDPLVELVLVVSPRTRRPSRRVTVVANRDGSARRDPGTGHVVIDLVPGWHPVSPGVRALLGTALTDLDGAPGSFLPSLDPSPATVAPPWLVHGLTALIENSPPVESAAQIGAYLRQANKVRLTPRATRRVARTVVDAMDVVERSLDDIVVDAPLFIEFPDAPRRAELARERAEVAERAARERGGRSEGGARSWRRDAAHVMDVGFLYVPDPVIDGRVVVVSCWRRHPGEETYGHVVMSWYGPDLARLAAMSRRMLSRDPIDAQHRIYDLLVGELPDVHDEEVRAYAAESGTPLDTRHEARVIASAKLDAGSEGHFALALLSLHGGREATFTPHGDDGDEIMDLPPFVRPAPGPTARARDALSGLKRDVLRVLGLSSRQGVPSPSEANGS